MNGSMVRQQPLVFVDIETTGGSYKFARVLEVGVVRVENNIVVSTFKTLLNPGTAVPPMITKLTGITTNDIAGAPSFRAIADELSEILEGATFVAHNVQFDYGFLRMEFERMGAAFRPKLLCTVRLSRKLFPEVRGHKLADLIERHGFNGGSRHRAYDDANVLWQFYRLILGEFDLDTVDEAIAAQMKSQSLPSELDKNIVDDLPDTPGVYIFEDASGQPLYVGKSINIRTRVMSHFTQYHDNSVERRIATDIRNVRTVRTHGELGALLTESKLVKELQPLHNRRLRKRAKVTLVRRHYDPDGYMRLETKDADIIAPEDAGNIMAVYATTTRAKESLNTIARNFYLCPKLMNLEKASGGCFLTQLGKCRGACMGEESTDDYNERLESAFSNQRLHGWPFRGPVIITETSEGASGQDGFIVDKWCLVARLCEDEDGSIEVAKQDETFDLDMYKILRSYINNVRNKRRIRLLSEAQARQLIDSTVWSS